MSASYLKIEWHPYCRTTWTSNIVEVYHVGYGPSLGGSCTPLLLLCMVRGSFFTRLRHSSGTQLCRPTTMSKVKIEAEGGDLHSYGTQILNHTPRPEQRETILMLVYRDFTEFKRPLLLLLVNSRCLNLTFGRVSFDGGVEVEHQNLSGMERWISRSTCSLRASIMK